MMKQGCLELDLLESIVTTTKFHGEVTILVVIPCFKVGKVHFSRYRTR